LGRIARVIRLPFRHQFPVPVSVTFCGLFDALSVMVMLADREPLAFGLNVTVSVQLAPGASELLVQPLFVKSAELVPPSVMLVKFKAEVPVLFRTTVLLLVLFTLWVPKLKVVGRNVIENIDVSGLGGNPGKQECFYTGAFFEGNRMYLRGEEYLYGIGQE
jgi:hypothetical protein